MSTLVAELAEQIQRLSGPEKSMLLRMLHQEIDATAGQDADEVWRFEVERRVNAIHRGEANLITLPD